MGDELDDKTVADLRDIAESEGVDLTGITLKAEIVDAIEKKRAGDGEASKEEKTLDDLKEEYFEAEEKLSDAKAAEAEEQTKVDAAKEAYLKAAEAAGEPAEEPPVEPPLLTTEAVIASRVIFDEAGHGTMEFQLGGDRVASLSVGVREEKWDQEQIDAGAQPKEEAATA